MVRDVPKSVNQPKEMVLIICKLFSFLLLFSTHVKPGHCANGKEILGITFRTEKEEYLWRKSEISKQIFQIITVPFDFQLKFLEILP